MLGWSINLFRLFGIQLAVHASFGLLLAYYGYEGWVDGGFPALGWNLLLISLFFVCVVLHELGHSLTARRYGVRVPRILLLPIGGMAEFDRIPRQPTAELLITIAGPAVNFVLAILLLPLVWSRLAEGGIELTYSFGSLLEQLWWANLIMGLFNLLPVFPMDGGRILRALLAFKFPYLRATWWAATVGKVLAPILAYIAFVHLQLNLLGVLFVFIFFVGDAEYRQTRRREQEDAYWQAMARRVVSVPPADATDPRPPLILHGPN